MKIKHTLQGFLYFPHSDVHRQFVCAWTSRGMKDYLPLLEEQDQEKEVLYYKKSLKKDDLWKREEDRTGLP